jgi:hypothetical protein
MVNNTHIVPDIEVNNKLHAKSAGTGCRRTLLPLASDHSYCTADASVDKKRPSKPTVDNLDVTFSLSTEQPLLSSANNKEAVNIVQAVIEQNEKVMHSLKSKQKSAESTLPEEVVKSLTEAAKSGNATTLVNALFNIPATREACELKVIQCCYTQSKLLRARKRGFVSVNALLLLNY